MKVTLQHLPKSSVALTIELTPDEVRPFLERAAAKLSERRTIPGFRPGKVPYEVMRKAVGDDVIFHEALEPIVRATLPQAIQEQKLVTVGAPNVEIIKLAPDNPLIYKATLGLLPKVSLGDYKSLKVERKPVEVTDEEVNKLVLELRASRAAEKLVPRQAQMDDKVELDFTAYLDKVPVEGGTSKTHPLILGSKSFVPGFEEQIIGMKAGEEREFTLRFPKDYYKKNMADRDVEFKVRVVSVFERALPETNDEFAKSFGNFITLAELKEHLQKNRLEEKEREEKERFELSMLEKIVEVSRIEDMPDSLVNGELDKMVDELKSSISYQGMDFARYLESIKKTEEDVRKDLRPQAERRMKLSLITRAIADAEHIEISNDEVRKEIDDTKKLYENNADILKSLASPEYFSYLKNVLSSKKVCAFLAEMLGGNKSKK